MRFCLIDRIIERDESRAVTVKSVSNAEEYLLDHFPTFPVLPGVLMIEAMVQAARSVLEARAPGSRFVLGGARAVKYGAFVRPGDALTVEVALIKEEDGVYHFKGTGSRAPAGGVGEAGGSAASGGSGGAPTPQTAVSGRFTMRPLRPPSGRDAG